MASEWTVTNVIDPSPEPFQGPKGPLVTYWMGISDAPDDEGHEDKLVYWTRQPDSPAPHVGLVIFGDYTQTGTTKKGKPKLKFKPQERPDGSSPIKGGQGNAGSRNAPSHNGHTQVSNVPWSDSRSLRIERQHSQEMALIALPLFEATPSKDKLKEWTDYFNDDLDDYERSRQGLKTSAPAPTLGQAAEGKREGDGDSAPTSLEDEILSGDLSDTDDIPF